MSRARFAVLVFAALLVAGGLYVSTVVQHSMPKEPLRFSIVETPGPRELYEGLSGPCSVESIAVENVSASPVHLISMWVAEQEPSQPGKISFTVEPVRKNLTTVAGSGVIVIPPHGTVYASSGVPLAGIATEAEDATMSEGRVRMNFLWQSQANYFVGRLFEWAYQHSPRSLKHRIPAVATSLNHASLERTGWME